MVLRLRDKSEGPDSPAALRIAKTLGHLYAIENNFREAEKLLKRVLNARDRLFAWDHLLSITILRSLGNLYMNHNVFEDAESALTRALAKAEKAFGEVNEMTLNIIIDLGSCYSTQNERLEAERMLDRRLHIQEALLGPNDSSTIDTVARLGALKFELRHVDAAEKMFLRVLGFPTGSHAVGLDVLQNLDVGINLSLLYVSTRRIHDAIQLLQRMCVLIPQRPDVDVKMSLLVAVVLKAVEELQNRRRENFRPMKSNLVEWFEIDIEIPPGENVKLRFPLDQGPDVFR